MANIRLPESILFLLKKQRMKTFFLLFCSALLGLAGLRPTTETILTGLVTDQESKEMLIGVSVQVTKDRKLINGTTTGADGTYSLPLPPGDYEVAFSYTGYTTQRITGVKVVASQKNTLDVSLSTSAAALSECVVVGYGVARQKNESAESPESKRSRSEAPRKTTHEKSALVRYDAPAGKAAAKPTTVTAPPPVSPSMEDVKIRGSRSTPTDYYLDGVKVSGSASPEVNKDDNPYRGNIFHTRKLDPESGHPVEKDAEGRLKPADKDLHDSSPDVPEEPAPRAGLLTAGEWNDLHNWNKHWLDLLSDGEITQYETLYGFFPKNRSTILLTNAQDFPVADAVVQLHDASGALIWEARTDNTGKAELWSGLFDQKELTGLRAEAWIDGRKHDLAQPKPAKDGINRHQIQVDCQAPKNVDIVWAVDATGSMGDEIEYLKTELFDVIGRAKSNNPELAFRMGTVFYRDHGDEYLTKSSGLSPDIAQTVGFITKQFAGGGGDYPEAVESALEEAIFNQKWSENAIARICFLVLDASPHQSPEINASLQRSIREAARRGIRIVPVAASGIQKDTEFLLKFFGLATNGSYVFLTDHSGIGGKHIEPTTDEYKVEMLNDLLVRLITEYTTVKTCAGQSAIRFEDPQAQPNQPQPATWQALYYPNPASTQFTLDLPFAVQSVTIYDAEGKAVRKLEKPQAGLQTVIVSDLAPSFYTIRILKDGRMQSGKLMVVRS